MLPEGYPYILPDETARVEGILLLDIDAAALQVLDRYEDEGRHYRRTAVEVVTHRGAVRAMTYVGLRG